MEIKPNARSRPFIMFRDIFNYTDMKNHHISINRENNRIILHIHINLILDHIFRHLAHALIRLHFFQLQLSILFLAHLKSPRGQPLLHFLLFPLRQFLLMLFSPLIHIVGLQLNSSGATASHNRRIFFRFLGLRFGGRLRQVLKLVTDIFVFFVDTQSQDFRRLCCDEDCVAEVYCVIVPVVFSGKLLWEGILGYRPVKFRLMLNTMFSWRDFSFLSFIIKMLSLNSKPIP